MITLDEHKGITVEDMYYGKEDVINILRLQKELFVKENIIATIEECINIWQTHSSNLCASWLYFPNNDNAILSEIKADNNFTSFEGYSK